MSRIRSSKSAQVLSFYRISPRGTVEDVRRVFLAQAAISAFDWVEFILQREVEASEADREWLDKPRGRDRLELRDPNNPPPNYPPSRPRPTVYNEVWEFEATNVVLQAENL